MSLHNTFTHAVVCFGNNDGVLLSIDAAAEVIKLLGAGIHVEYSWGNSAYKYKTTTGRNDTLRLDAINVTQLATMELEKDAG